MKFYYIIKPLLPRSFQIFLRRQHVRRQRAKFQHVWPINPGARNIGTASPRWPQGRGFAFVLTHDVDTARGQGRCRMLREIEAGMGFRSSFNFVPERYAVDPALRAELDAAGFEVGVHGLNHDGKLYSSKAEFARRAVRINRYLKKWGAVGFRSPAMHHNLEWLKALDIEYDASTFDTDPFEPQPDGVGTIFPFWVARGDGTGYVELPYTLAQDFTLFVLMRETTIDVWKRKLDWIAEKGGMALVNTHPDYMCFGDGRPGLEEYPMRLYEQLLEYVKDRYEGQYWHALPREAARFWREQGVCRKSLGAKTKSASNHRHVQNGGLW